MRNTVQLTAYLRLMRFDKPVGTLLLLWPCWWALTVANRLYVSTTHFLVFTLGVIVMRAAGCIANDIADRNFDGHVERTKTRPLVTGAISLKQALSLLVVLLSLALLLVLQLNRATVLLSLIGALLAVTYPLMKRWIQGPQLFLGLAFSWSVPMVFSATNAPFDSEFAIIYVLALMWPVIYDTFYAITDRDDDLKIGVNSTAIWFGTQDRLILTGLQMVFAALLLCLPYALHLTFIYYIGMVPVLALMGYQLYLIYQQDRMQAFKAFKLSQWQGGFIFAALCMGYYF